MQYTPLTTMRRDRNKAVGKRLLFDVKRKLTWRYIRNKLDIAFVRPRIIRAYRMLISRSCIQFYTFCYPNMRLR